MANKLDLRCAFWVSGFWVFGVLGFRGSPFCIEHPAHHILHPAFCILHPAAQHRLARLWFTPFWPSDGNGEGVVKCMWQQEINMTRTTGAASPGQRR